MTFINDAGDVLNISATLATTKQAVSFFNSKIKGDLTINFDVPNTAENRAALNYNGPQDVNQVAFQRQPWTLTNKAGNRYTSGYIVIQSDEGANLSCYFISGNSNWMNALDSLITELDYSGVVTPNNYDFLLNTANYLTLRVATSGMVMPLVDWCYKWNKGDNRWFIGDIFDNGTDVNKTYFELYPCFYLHTILTEISNQKGIKFAGSILTDPLFKSLIITPENGEIKRPSINNTTATGSQTTTALSTTFTMSETSDPENLFASSQYTANKTSEVRVTLSIASLTVTVGAWSATVSIQVNGVNVASTSFGSSVSDYQILWKGPIVSGDVIRVVFGVGAGGSTTLDASIKIEIPTLITSGDLIKANYFLPELSCFDIVKFVINFFGCTASYDQYSKTIKINQIEKVNLSNAFDWSDYYVSHTVDYTIESAANNYMRVAKASDTQIKAYNRQNFVGYGEGNITTANTLKEQNDLIKIPFAASGFDLATNGDWLTSIPLVDLKDSGDPIVYTAIGTSIGRAVYTVADTTSFTKQIFRIVDDINGDIGYFLCEVGLTGTTARFFQTYPGATGTGKLYKQSLTYNSVGPRILSVTTSTDNDIVSISNKDTSYTISDYITTDSRTGIGLANFCKSVTGLGADNIKLNCAFDNPNSPGFSDPSVKAMYFGRISKMLGNPTITVKFLLPEYVFDAFDFQNFITLKTAKLTGTFYVSKISNYTDSLTEVEVTLLML